MYNFEETRLPFQLPFRNLEPPLQSPQTTKQNHHNRTIYTVQQDRQPFDPFQPKHPLQLKLTRRNPLTPDEQWRASLMQRRYEDEEQD